MGKKSGNVRIKQMGGMKPPSKAALASMMQPPKLEDFMVAPDEQISLPPIMNKKYQMFYPIHETFTMQTDNFRMIYPSYIDPTKTIQQGRRIPLHLLTTAVSAGSSGSNNNNILMDDLIETNDMLIESNHNVTGGNEENNNSTTIVLLAPTIQEISQALQSLNIRHVIQPYKCYSRCDPYENPGRCLVDMNCSGRSNVETYRNKMELLILIAKQIQLLPSRPQRIEQEMIRQQELQKETAAKQLQLSLTTTANTTTTTTEQQHIATVSGPNGSHTTTTTNKKKSNNKKKK